MLQFLGFRDAGNARKERVVFVAKERMNVGNLLVCRTLARNGDVYPEIYDTLWLPDITVEKGDYVSIYSKSGNTGSKIGENGRTTHFLYWGRESPIWDNDEVAAVLMNVASWSAAIPTQ